MFFKKKILTAAIIYNKDNSFLVTYSKDTNGMTFMSGATTINYESIDKYQLGEMCLKGLTDFKFKAASPEDIANKLNSVNKKVGCKSWNNLVDEYYFIGLEGQKNKFVVIQPSTKNGGVRSRYYSTIQDKVERVGWDAKALGNVICKLINK